MSGYCTCAATNAVGATSPDYRCEACQADASPVGGEVDVAQELRRHMVYGFNGTEVLCDCHEVGWLTRAEYAAHAQAALLARLEAAESARDEALAVAYDDGYNDAVTMAHIYGHTDHWPDDAEPRNPYRTTLTPSAPTADRVLCWCRPGSPDLPVTSPHAKNDRCTRMTGSLADGLVTPSAPTEEER